MAHLNRFRIECHLSLQKNDNSESNEALGTSEAGPAEPAAEQDKQEQDEGPHPLSGVETVTSTAGAEVEESPPPSAGEVDDYGSAPAGEEDAGKSTDSPKEEKPAVSE